MIANLAASEEFDVVVVGAGLSGLYTLIRMRELGLRVCVIERGHDVGGTWFWNRYPGARCDIESVDYCYSFSKELLKEWSWSERFATQPEILQYIEFVADTFDVRRDIRFSTRVIAAEFDESCDRWQVSTSDGRTLNCQFLILAVGNLSEPKKPDIPGVDTFSGESLHTAEWPSGGFDFTGKRVGVVGTGSSGIQAIPIIARQAEHLHVFQRTPNYSMPARNAALDSSYVEEVLEDYESRRDLCRWSDAGTPFPPAQKGALEVSDDERQEMYARGWQRGGINSLSYAFTDFFTSEEANATAQEFVRARIRELVHDPSTAAALCPTHHIGTKRTCVDTDYFVTFNRDNVTLVDLRRDPIIEITGRGVRTREHDIPLDCLVYAIGFDAMTGAVEAIEIVGRAGKRLRQVWAEGPRTYLGLATAGFPNLFMVTGPGSPGVLSNMMVSIEQHVDWIADCLAFMARNRISRIEAGDSAQSAWVDHVNELASATLYPQADSWYVGANIPGKPRVFVPYVNGCGNYRRECEDVTRQGYLGFILQGSESSRS